MSKLTDIIRALGAGTRLAARVTALTGGTSAVDAIVVTAGGTGYTSAPTVGFSGGGGSGAAATAVVSGGQVISVTVTAVGSGYTSVPTINFTGGGGSGATATAVLLALTLDAVPTLTLAVTPIPFVFIVLSGRITAYQLRAGTDAESSPFIIRPDDYSASTNEKVWQLVGMDLLNNMHELRTLTYGATTDLNFNDSSLMTLSLTGNVTFTTSNRGAGKRLLLRIIADASIRTFTFPAWKFIGGTAPANIAASKEALLDLTGFGSADTDVRAQYFVEP